MTIAQHNDLRTLTRATAPAEAAPWKGDQHDPQAFDLRVITDLAGFAALERQWNTLVESSPRSTIFQTFEWAYQWWRHFGAGPYTRLHLMAIYRLTDGELAGLAPLYIDRYGLKKSPIHRQLRLLGSAMRRTNSVIIPESYGPSDYLDLLALPGYEMIVARHVVEQLSRESHLYDEVECANVREESILMEEVVPLLARSDTPHQLVQTDMCPYLAVPASEEQFYRDRDSNMRHRLYQSRKTFIDKGAAFTIESIESEEAIPGALDTLIRLHQQRWNRQGYPGLFTDPGFRSFLVETTAGFLRTGRLWFKLLRSGDGEVLAARLAYNCSGRFYDYLSGFDDRAAAARKRPGLALLLCLIRDAITGNHAAVDFLRGNEKYKFELTSEFSQNWTITVQHHHPRRRIIHGAAYRSLRLLSASWRQISKEMQLLGIHYREHGALRCSYRYLDFRFGRIREKFLRRWHASTGSLT